MTRASSDTKENSTQYTQLDADLIDQTICELRNRITERFPDSGLAQVVKELHTVAKRSRSRAEACSKPILWVRALTVLLLGVVIGAVIAALIRVEWNVGNFGLLEAVGALEAAINDVVLTCAGIFFLLTIENRIHRQRTLKALHELRSIAHVIDMHQLTKDPEHVLPGTVENTASSPKRTMSAHLLSRYLDYCSEMLALTGKLAALHTQSFNDSVVLSSVNEIESLTTGLSRKVWQKLMILHSRQY